MQKSDLTGTNVVHQTTDRLDSDVPVRVTSWSASAAKRIFDGAIAFIVLTVAAIPMALIGVAVRLTSEGTALFVQERIGARGRVIRVIKFRTMTNSASGPGLTRVGDSRITLVGRLLRRFKLDELPQFYNVLRGDMSLVGPRPKLARYAESSTMPWRPGITGAATVEFRGEEGLLAGFEDSEKMDAFYFEYIRPMKARLDEEYMSGATLFSDLRLMAETAIACTGLRGPSKAMRSLWRLRLLSNERGYNQLRSGAQRAISTSFAVDAHHVTGD
jgi:lipopolysaccharide/colanic/teichoic acid biosynthesis glycosyltransferase